MVGVTGSIPARFEQTKLVNSALPVLEIVSVLAVMVIVGFAFRSIVAPLLTIVTAGISYALVSASAGVVAALPVLNAERVVPSSKRTGTTLVTYLYTPPGSFRQITEAAERYAAETFDA